MRIAGAFLIVLGLLFCLSIVGAVIGIPLIFIGLVLIVVGGRRKTVITNVVQVSNSLPAAADAARAPTNRVELDYDPMPGLRAPSRPRAEIADRRTSVADALSAQDDDEFLDIEHEISEASLAILRAAKVAGYQVRYSRAENRVLVSRPPEEGEMALASNHAILAFGHPRGYARR